MSVMFDAVSDAAVIAKRNVIKIKRVPEVLVFVLLSPIMFVLLFAYVFGDSIAIPGGSYREFLIAGHLRPDGRVRFRSSPAPVWPRISRRGS